MPLREDILEPIAGNSPSGRDLRYDPVYDKIKEARRQDDDVQMGVWQYERKVADWPAVLKHASELIAKRSKDLQLAAWLTEALTNLEGFSGFAEGVSLMRSMTETFWDTLYPELEDGDAELRSVPLQFVSVKCDAALRRVPLTAVGVDFSEYKTSVSIPSEADVAADSKKRAARLLAEEDGKTTPEMVEDALKQTQAAFFQELQQELLRCREEVDALDELGNQRFQEYAPNFSHLKDTLDEIRNAVRILSQRKGGAAGKPETQATAPPQAPARSQPPASSSDPFAALDAANDPFAALDATVAEPQPAAAAYDPFAALDAATTQEPEPVPPQPPAKPASDPFAHLDLEEEEPAPEPQRPTRSATRSSFSTPEPQDLDDASARLASIARWLRKQDPRNPAPYLLLRGFRWGELRGGGADPEWFLLDAPTTEVRQNLKRLASEQNWEELLQESEDAMALPCGRAWLDLQRYTLTALKYLGDPYVRADAAIRASLRGLLAEFPALTQRSLNDDTPAANAETVDLFRRDGLFESPSKPHSPLPAAPPPNDDETITEAIRMRRFDQALQLVSARLALETTGRGRFQRKSQLAQILVASGRQAVAFPILRELCADIEARHLEQWETSSLIVEPLVLLHRCLEKMEDAAEEKKRIYTLVCRLDPLRAFELN